MDSNPRFEIQLLTFVDLLRRLGLRVSTAEVLDGYRACTLIDIWNRSLFSTALMGTLVKLREDEPTFERAFNLFFQLPLPPLPTLSAEEFAEELANLNTELAELGTSDTSSEPPTPQQDESNNDAALLQAGSEADIQQRAHELAHTRELVRWELDDVDATVQRILQETGVDVALAQVAKARGGSARERYEQLREALTQELELTMVQLWGTEAITEVLEQVDLMEQDLTSLTEDQLAALVEQVKQLVKRLRTRLSTRTKQGKHGRLDMRQTVRRKAQGYTELRYKRRQKRKTNLVIFCDVSGSVYLYVGFMLQLVLALQHGFKKVTSYVFNDIIKDVTSELNGDVDVQALVYRYTTDPRLGSTSDFGLAFHLLNQANSLDRQTTLIVLGDAVCYDQDPRVAVFRQLTQQARNTYWLNPMPKVNWGEHGCAQLAYAPYCNKVHECRNINQLITFIRTLT